MILGASGSGKSTFLNIISGLESPDRGTVSYDGTDITALSDEKLTAFRKEHIGFIFQQYYLLPDMNVEQNVKMGADLAHNKDYKSVIQAVGLGDKLHKYPSQLSGGQQQRVSVARALAKKPKVLFLDEPTRELDESTGRQVLDYICKLKDQYGFTIVMVTHNLNIAEMAKTVIRMNSGKISHMYQIWVFGYSQKECCKAILGGYRPVSYIGFAIGTLYQYALLRVMIDLVFKDVDGVAAYEFDVPIMLLSLAVFILLYEILMAVYSDRIKKISRKEIMLE